MKPDDSTLLAADPLEATVGLTRYGLQWNGPTDFVATPMPDGYWTPWHLAQAEIDRLRAALRMGCDALAEFHQTGDVPDVLDVMDAALALNAN